MDIKRCAEVMIENKDKVYTWELNSWEVGIVHGMIRLSLERPAAPSYCATFMQGVERLRELCVKAFDDMGFTQEEIESLDSEVH